MMMDPVMRYLDDDGLGDAKYTSMMMDSVMQFLDDDDGLGDVISR